MNKGDFQMSRTFSIKMLCALTFISLSSQSAAQVKEPEFLGVYARYSDGTLIQLKPVSADLTRVGMMYEGISSYLDRPKFSYVSSQPKVTLDLKKLNGFIIYGDKPTDKTTAIWYFSKIDGFRFGDYTGKNPGEGWISIGVNCGPADGMQYKKLKEGMYLFQFPVEETGDEKYCNLSSNHNFTFKQGSRSVFSTAANPTFKVNFYGWYYGGQHYLFNVK